MRQNHISRYFLTGFAAVIVAGNLEAALPERQGWWATFDLGFGFLHQRIDGIAIDDSTFYLGAGVGYAVTPNFLAGIEFNGWSIQPSNELFAEPGDPPEGEAIAQYLVVARLYPSSESKLYAKLGAGYARHWNLRWGEESRSGTCFQLGVGYHVFVQRGLSMTPAVSYSFGTVGNEDYQAFTLSVGLAWD